MRSCILGCVFVGVPFFLLASMASCSDDASTGAPASPDGAPHPGTDGGPGQSFSASIGPSGGELKADTLTIYIPPGTLTATTTFTVTVKDPAGYPSASEVLGPVYNLEPEGFQFGRPIMLMMPAAKRPPAGEGAVIATVDPGTNTWVPLEGSVERGDPNAGNAVVMGRTTHFSPYTTYHAPNKFDERCRPYLNGAGIVGLNKPDSLNISNATVVYRQKYGGIEYGSVWDISAPSVTITGEAMLAGNGQWAAWEAGHDFARPKPVPTGFAMGTTWSLPMNIKQLMDQGFVNISIDEFCPGDYDIAWNCVGGCAGGGDAGADAGPPPPLNCTTGTQAPTTSPRKLLLAGNTLLGADDLTATNAFSTWSIANPLAPALLDSVNLNASSTSRQIAVSGTTAFVTDGTRITAINIADPANITVAGFYDLNADAALKAALGNTTINAQALAISGSKAFVATSANPDGGFVVLDITNPAAMTRGAYLTNSSAGAREMQIVGTKAYLSSNENRVCFPGPCATPSHRGVMVFDISNPSAPTKSSTITINGAQPNGLAIAGNYLYLADGNTKFYIVDLTNPSATPPSIDTNGFAYGALVVGSRLYISSNSGEQHLQVYSLQNPGMPQRQVDQIMAPNGGGYGVAANASHAWVGGVNRLSAGICQ